MPSRRLVLVFVLLLPLFFPTVVPAAQAAEAAEAAEAADLLAPLVDADPFALPADDLLALAEGVAEVDPPPDEATVDLLLLEIHHDVAADGTAVYQRREVYRLLTADAVDVWGSVETGWTSWIQKRPELDARVVTTAGREVRLDPATVVDTAADAGAGLVYSDQRNSRAPLPALAVGAVVEVLVRVVDTRPMLAEGGVARRSQLFSVEPARRVRLVIEGPREMPLRWHGVGGVGQPVEATADDGVRLTFDLADQPAWDFVVGRPPEVPLGPTVDFSFGASWNGVARAYAEVVERQLAAVGADAPLLAGDGDSQWDTIAARLADLHDRLRYTSVALGDSGIIPRTPTETLERGYGDCKDLSLLLVASLRREGVPAYLALLRAASGSDDVHGQVPGFGLFDHVIVYVPGSPALWIDPTDPYSPLGELPPSVEGRWALVTSPETGDLVQIPVSPSGDHRLVELRTFGIAQHGLGRVTEESEGTGSLGRSLRSGWMDLDTPEESLGDYALGNYLAEDVVSAEVVALEPTAGPVVTRVEVAGSALVFADDDGATARIDPSDLFSYLPQTLRSAPSETAAPRTVDYHLERPYRVEHRYRLPIPTGFEVAELPVCPSQELGAATLDCTVEEVDGEVRVDLVFDTRGPRYTPEEAVAMGRRIADIDATYLTLDLDRTAARLVRQGRTAEAVAEHRRLAALAPDEALHPALLADTLLEVGLRDAALVEARRAVELAPESARAWYALGWVAMHDEIGRDLAPGYRRAEAAEALAKAYELAPDDASITFNLAQVLAWEEDSETYAVGPDLDRAIELYREIGDALAESEFRHNLYHFLYAADRRDELLEELDGEPEGIGQWAVYLAAQARAGATGEAAERATRDLRAASETLLAAVGRAVLLLIEDRHYAEAEALLVALDGLGMRPRELTALRRLVTDLDRYDPDRFDLDDPAERGLTLLASFLDPAAEGRDDLWTLELEEHYRERGNDDFVGDYLETTVAQLESAGVPGGREVLRDLLTSLLQPSATGDPRYGWRVDVESDHFPLPEAETVFHLAVRDGGLRLATLENESEVLAGETTRWLERGDLEAARWWGSQTVQAFEWLTGLLPDVVAERFESRLGPLEEGTTAAEIEAALALVRRFWGEEPSLGPIIEEFFDQAEEAADRPLLAAAALAAYFQEGNPDQALELLRRARAEGVEIDDAAAINEAELVVATGRHDEAVSLFEALLAAETDDDQRWRLELRRAETLLAAGRTDEGLAALEAVAERSGVDSAGWNNLAWRSLVAERVDERTLQWAERSVQLAEPGDYPSLHTLASVYAALDRPADAYRTLLSAYPDAARGAVSPVDWWVYGRIAESLDLPEAARVYYQRVLDETPPESHGVPGGTPGLARRSLDRLAAGETAPGGG